jgi:hypothetical protein
MAKQPSGPIRRLAVADSASGSAHGPAGLSALTAAAASSARRERIPVVLLHLAADAIALGTRA